VGLFFIWSDCGLIKKEREIMDETGDIPKAKPEEILSDEN